MCNSHTYMHTCDFIFTQCLQLVLKLELKLSEQHSLFTESLMMLHRCATYYLKFQKVTHVTELLFLHSSYRISINNFLYNTYLPPSERAEPEGERESPLVITHSSLKETLFAHIMIVTTLPPLDAVLKNYSWRMHFLYDRKQERRYMEMVYNNYIGDREKIKVNENG